MINVRLSWSKQPNLLLSGKLTQKFDNSYDIRIEYVYYNEENSPYGAEEELKLSQGQKVKLREIVREIKSKTTIANINVVSTDKDKTLTGIFYQCLNG